MTRRAGKPHIRFISGRWICDLENGWVEGNRGFRSACFWAMRYSSGRLPSLLPPKPPYV